VKSDRVLRPLLCNASGLRRRLVKHEEDAAGPTMAKRLRQTQDDPLIDRE